MSDGEKKKVAAKKPADHPKYIDMIVTAITNLKERTGSSRQAIIKYVEANNKVSDNANVHIKLALKRAVAAGKLIQTKGTGASGSFKVAKAEPKKKKPAAKKPAAKKTATKKAPKKSPAKKKPAAKKAPKKTPTKKKPAAKKTAKKVAAKKPAAKKAAKKTPKKAAKK